MYLRLICLAAMGFLLYITSAQEECPRSITTTGYYTITYSYNTSSYCGWWRRSCTRTAYRRVSRTIYTCCWGSGTSCLPVCTNPCQNGGNCTAPDQCSCPPEWTGYDCGTRLSQPVIHSTFQEQYASLTATISCQFSSCPNQYLTWNGPGLGSLTARERITVLYEDTQSILNITNLMEEDEGEYYCNCSGFASAPSLLLVLYQPSFLSARSNQTFYRNETAVILCHADPGDPPHQVIWKRNNSRIFGDFVQLRQQSNPIEALIIENIQDSDAGEYVCGFNLSTGFVSTTIAVIVMDLPQGTIRFVLPSIVSIRYGDPLMLECRTEPSNPLLQYTWFIAQNNEIYNRTLWLSPEQIYIGTCRCSVFLDGQELAEHSVFLNVINIPPIPEDPNLPISSAILEGEKLIMFKNLRFALNLDNLTIQWEKIIQDRRLVHDFDTRFTYFFRDTRLILVINNTQLSDRGSYQMTLSNDYGHAVVMITLNIFPLTRITISMRFADISCDILQDHHNDILRQVAVTFSCPVCGDVKVQPGGNECSFNDVKMKLTLLSQDTLPQINQVTLIINGFSTIADVCYGDCAESTGTTLLNTTAAVESSDGTMIILSTTLPTLSLVLILGIIALSLLAFLCKRRYSYSTSRNNTGRENDQIEFDLSTGKYVYRDKDTKECEVKASYRSGKLNEGDLLQVLNSVSPAVIQWKEMGLALGFPYPALESIDQKHPNSVENCLREVIRHWLQRQEDTSWEALCNALRNEAVNHNEIALEIEQQAAKQS